MLPWTTEQCLSEILGFPPEVGRLGLAICQQVPGEGCASAYPTFFAGGGDQVPLMIEGGVSVGQ